MKITPDKNEDVVLRLPASLWKAKGWKVGEELEWIINDSGQILLSPPGQERSFGKSTAATKEEYKKRFDRLAARMQYAKEHNEPLRGLVHTAEWKAVFGNRDLDGAIELIKDTARESQAKGELNPRIKREIEAHCGPL